MIMQEKAVFLVIHVDTCTVIFIVLPLVYMAVLTTIAYFLSSVM